MERDTKIAIIHTTHSHAAIALSTLSHECFQAVMSVGGDVGIKCGKSPNGMDCTLVARFRGGKCIGYFAVGGGKEQPIANGHVNAVIAKIY